MNKGYKTKNLQPGMHNWIEFFFENFKKALDDNQLMLNKINELKKEIRSNQQDFDIVYSKIDWLFAFKEIKSIREEL